MHPYRLSALARAARAPLTSHHRGAPRGVPGMRPEVVRASLHAAGMVHAGCGGGAGMVQHEEGQGALESSSKSFDEDRESAGTRDAQLMTTRHDANDTLNDSLSA